MIWCGRRPEGFVRSLYLLEWSALKVSRRAWKWIFRWYIMHCDSFDVWSPPDYHLSHLHCYFFGYFNLLRNLPQTYFASDRRPWWFLRWNMRNIPLKTQNSIDRHWKGLCLWPSSIYRRLLGSKSGAQNGQFPYPFGQ